MSGFTAAWLDLRAPADDRARDPDLARAFRAALPPSPRILDLGSGTGSTARALGMPQARWTFVDDDGDLLSEAARRVPGARTLRADLSRDLAAVLACEADAITASALFDLVSEEWIERFADGAAGRIVYAALTYDGTEAWHPGHPADDAVARAFDSHQSRDKGFGPAAGARGAAVLARALEARGHAVRLAPSPWRLEREGDGALMDALAEGVSSAAMDAGCDPGTARGWLAARRGASRCIIGHLDLLALPGD